MAVPDLIVLSDVELGYLAGLFDGEGSIAIIKMRRPPHRETSFNLNISITNSDPEMLDLVHRRLGGHICVMGRYKGRGKLVKRWYQSGYKAAPILRRLLPVLIAKRKQAVLALEYLEMGRGWARERRAEMYDEMRALNRHGRASTHNGAESSACQSLNGEPALRASDPGGTLA